MQLFPAKWMACLIRIVVLVSGASLALAGCASFGPVTVTRDRFNYVASMSDSWK